MRSHTKVTKRAQTRASFAGTLTAGGGWFSSPPWAGDSRACAHARATRKELEAGHGEVLELEPFLDSVLRAFAADARLLDAAERRHLGRDEAGVQRHDPGLERLAHAPGAAPPRRTRRAGRESGSPRCMSGRNCGTCRP